MGYDTPGTTFMKNANARFLATSPALRPKSDHPVSPGALGVDETGLTPGDTITAMLKSGFSSGIQGPTEAANRRQTLDNMLRAAAGNDPMSLNGYSHSAGVSSPEALNNPAEYFNNTGRQAVIPSPGGGITYSPSQMTDYGPVGGGMEASKPWSDYFTQMQDAAMEPSRLAASMERYKIDKEALPGGGKLPNSEFGVTMKSLMDGGLTQQQALDKMQNEKIKMQESRYGHFQQAKGAPVGVTYDRYKNKFYAADGTEMSAEQASGLAGSSASFKADSSSLANLQKGADSIDAFEKDVKNSMDIVKGLSDKMAQGAYPDANKLSLLLQYHSGDPIVQSYKMAVSNLMLEYMKVKTAGTGISSSELSIAAQQRANEILNAADSPATLENLMNTMTAEMGVKKKAFEDQKAEINKRLSGSTNNQSNPAPSAAVRKQVDRATGAVRYLDANGNEVQ